MLYTLYSVHINYMYLYSVAYQLYFNKTNKNKKETGHLNGMSLRNTKIFLYQNASYFPLRLQIHSFVFAYFLILS